MRFGSEVAIELLQHGAELWEADPKFSWEWQVVSRAGTTTIETDKERFTYLVQKAGKNLKVHCTLKNKGKPTDSCLALDFALAAGPYESFWAKGNEHKAIVELMAKRMIPLIEHDPSDNTPTVEKIKAEFMKLSTDQIWALWRVIRWPKSHVQGVADLLAFLKNRANRFPGLDRAAFCKDRRAMAIVATEYNRGATSSSASAAGPSSYGDYAASCCLDAGVLESIYKGFGKSGKRGQYPFFDKREIKHSLTSD